MSEQDAATATAVEARQELPPAAAIDRMLLSDDEMRRMYRVAESLALSGVWKDVRKAEAAFAKMVVGRDLGMTPAQAMQGIHFVEGNLQLHYSMIGNFIRAREGYDYEAGWIKREPVIDLGGREPTAQEQAAIVEGRGQLVWVPFTTEDPLDDREVHGAAVVITLNGERVGTSRFTLDDAQRAGLIKDNAKAAWRTVPRNMLLARAMSNAAKWFVPEVLGGLPVYTEGEVPERKSLTAPAGEGGDEGSGIELGPKVEAIIERAEKLGHRGLSNRAAIELAVGNRAPGVVNDWVKRAREELERFAAQKAEAAARADESSADPKPPQEQEVPAPEEEVDGEVVPDQPPRPESDAEARTDPEAAALLNRLQQLQRMDEGEDLSADDRDQLHAEIDMVEGRLRAMGVEVDQ